MTLVASILMLALTRAEIIERFKNPPVTRADGLVQVFADCPSDMRREYQGPVSSFVAEVCTTLSTALKERPGHFTQPAIIVYVGDIRTNNSQVVSREQVRPDGSVCTRIRLLAPGFTDTDQLRRETVKAFYRAANGSTTRRPTVVFARPIRVCASPRNTIRSRGGCGANAWTGTTRST